MKKRTVKLFYDKVCQRREAHAVTLACAGLFDQAANLRRSVGDRIRAKRKAAGWVNA